VSTDAIPYPSDFDADHLAAHHEECRRLALRRIDPGDVIATVEARLAEEADPRQHPLYELVCFQLDCLHAVDGAAFYDAWRSLVIDAINRCVVEILDVMED
jgi:hypothetical protein